LALNRYVFLGTAVGALGGLLFGFDTAVIAGAEAALTAVYHLSARELGLTVSIALVGTVVGALYSGSLGQRFGGRNMLRVMAVLYLLSSVGCAFSWSWPMLLLARFFGGLGIGGCSVLGPVYIAELAPAHLRGRLGMFQINIVLGILLAYLSNFIVAQFHLGAAEWRWELGIPAFPAATFWALLYMVPQSARWLATQGHLQEARDTLEKLGSQNVSSELEATLQAAHADAGHTEENLWQRRYRKPIFLAIAIGLFNQLAGINAILYYLNPIFAAAGFSKTSGDLQAVAIGAMNLAATFVAMTVIDRFGRRKLLLIGSVGMALCLAGVALVFYTHSHTNLLLWLLMAYIAFFAASQGAVIWVYISEIFPTPVRSKGQALGSSAHWIMNAILAGTFPVIAKVSGAAPFALFSAMMVLQFVAVYTSFPETKGRSLEDLQHILGTS
jgi:SP family arabinose:H+ symporter-like MFS transporter